MTTNAEKINIWYNENKEVLTETILKQVLGLKTLAGADFTGAILNDVDMPGANFEGAIFNNAEMAGANLAHANLAGAAFGETDLTEANLNHANLESAKMPLANMKYAQAKCANMKNTYLYRANLRRADLTGADVRGTDFRRAMLWNTKFHGFVLNNTLVGDVQLVPTIKGWRVSIGHWEDKTLKELKDLVNTSLDGTLKIIYGDMPLSRKQILQSIYDLCFAHAHYYGEEAEADLEWMRGM